MRTYGCVYCDDYHRLALEYCCIPGQRMTTAFTENQNLFVYLLYSAEKISNTHTTKKEPRGLTSTAIVFSRMIDARQLFRLQPGRSAQVQYVPRPHFFPFAFWPHSRKQGLTPKHIYISLVVSSASGCLGGGVRWVATFSLPYLDIFFS